MHILAFYLDAGFGFEKRIVSFLTTLTIIIIKWYPAFLYKVNLQADQIYEPSRCFAIRGIAHGHHVAHTCMRTHSQTLTHTHTHTHTHSHTHTHTNSLSHTLTHSLTLMHAHTLSHDI